ncbi:MAG: hypothetical protein KF830_16580 [Planctomycetes bacterium]|nr:hypothetical protein [Planctomycetota bacterium]
MLLTVAVSGATYAVLQALVISRLERERSDAHAKAERIEAEKSALATELGKMEGRHDQAVARIGALEKQSSDLNRQSGEGESSSLALLKAIQELGELQNDAWKAIADMQKRLEITNASAPPRREVVRMQVDSTLDRCSDSVVTVEGREGNIVVRKGESKEIPLSPSGEVFWSCGGTRERTATASGADIAVLSRDAQGRAMTWLFYKTVSR